MSKEDDLDFLRQHNQAFLSAFDSVVDDTKKERLHPDEFYNRVRNRMQVAKEIQKMKVDGWGDV